MGRAAPTPACTPSARSPISTCARRCRRHTLAARINDLLPADIHVLGATKVPHRFHARHDALSRTYVYQIARRRTAFAKPYVWWVKDDLRVGAMREAARVFTGRQDFRGFTDDDPEDKSTLVEVASVELIEDADALLLVVEGSHFLWKMVRRMTGVLVEVGRGGLEPRDVARLLASPSGLPAQLTAPSSGLFLARVVYPGDPPSEVPLPPGPRAVDRGRPMACRASSHPAAHRRSRSPGTTVRVRPPIRRAGARPTCWRHIA